MPAIYKFADFELDEKEEMLSRAGKTLPLNHRAFQVLLLLVQRAGETVTKEEFFESVWAESFVEENNLSVAAAFLRKALNDDPKRPRFIETVPRRGYKFIGEVTVADITPVELPTVSAASSEAAQLETPVSGLPSMPPAENVSAPRRFFHGRKILIVSAVCTVALLVGAGFKLLSPDPLDSASSQLFPTVKPAFESVAVLPFAYANVEEEYLADGFTEALTDALSQMSELRVISGSSTAKFKGEGTNTDEVAKRLGVKAIVTGKFEHVNDDILLNLALTDTAERTVIWTTQYRLANKNPTQVQTLIARDVALNLRVANAAAAKPRYQPDPKAYLLYLKGNYYWNRREEASDTGFYDRAVELFKEALDIDPAFALPYVGLANVYGQVSYGSKYCPRTPRERFEIVNGYLAKALELDPTLADTYASKGMSDLLLGQAPQWKSAEANFRKALELEPSNANAQHWLAEYLALAGRYDESYAAYDRAIALEPLSTAVRGDKCYAIWFAQRYEDAVTCMEEVRDLDRAFKRTYWYLLGIYITAERYNDVIETLRTVEHDNAMKKYAEEDYNSLKKALKDGGKTGFLKAYLHIWSREKSPWILAGVYSQLGENDKAFEQLDLAIETGGGGVVYTTAMPLFAPLHNDPRWATVRTRIGLDP